MTQKTKTRTKRKITKGKICWNCKHGKFSRRKGTGVARGKGRCFVDAGTPPFSRGWNPPLAFWVDVHNFPADFETFRQTLAPAYYGVKVKLEERYRYHISMERIEQEYEWMKWIAERIQTIHTVSWQNVCDDHAPS